MKSCSICQANKHHDSDYWYGRINDDGEVKYISLKTKRKSETQEWLAMMNARRFLPEERDGWKKPRAWKAVTPRPRSSRARMYNRLRPFH